MERGEFLVVAAFEPRRLDAEPGARLVDDDDEDTNDPYQANIPVLGLFRPIIPVAVREFDLRERVKRGDAVAPAVPLPW